MDPVDLDRLERVRRRAAPFASRDEAWIREFEAAFWPAPLVAPIDRLVYGSRDGRPYAVVSAPHGERAPLGLEPRHARPASLVDELIEKGRGLWFGIEDEAPWVAFTLGEILSYRLYGRAFEPLPPQAAGGDVALPAGSKIGLAPPDEVNFPDAVRINVRRHLRTALGIGTPRACWARFPNGREGIVLDLGSSSVTEEEALRAAFDAIRWMLPARLSYYRVDSLNEGEAMRPF